MEGAGDMPFGTDQFGALPDMTYLYAPLLSPSLVFDDNFNFEWDDTKPVEDASAVSGEPPASGGGSDNTGQYDIDHILAQLAAQEGGFESFDFSFLNHATTSEALPQDTQENFVQVADHSVQPNFNSTFPPTASDICATSFDILSNVSLQGGSGPSVYDGIWGRLGTTPYDLPSTSQSNYDHYLSDGPPKQFGDISDADLAKLLTATEDQSLEMPRTLAEASAFPDQLCSPYSSDSPTHGSWPLRKWTLPAISTTWMQFDNPQLSSLYYPSNLPTVNHSDSARTSFSPTPYSPSGLTTSRFPYRPTVFLELPPTSHPERHRPTTEKSSARRGAVRKLPLKKVTHSAVIPGFSPNRRYN
jgi:hypothetical protein